MSKNKLIHKICTAVLAENYIDKVIMESSNSCGRKTNYKKGIYFLFDNNNNVIYVGKVGNSADTSLYDRMVGHGNGSHKIKDARWYNEVIKGKFHVFNSLNESELKKIERLAIVGMGQPKYNDVDITDADIQSLLVKI